MSKIEELFEAIEDLYRNTTVNTTTPDMELISKLNYLANEIKNEPKHWTPVDEISAINPKSRHVGKSNYSEMSIQPWDVWEDWSLNAWDADIVKRIARTKVEEGMTANEQRSLDYQKIIHICEYRVSKLANE